ncbi:TM0106 family RecB-like putative nuclease [Mumia zhuanghuii]|uniref:TM0106 family RecB-like putative nuclease n=1 Tax=Mumia zhuanghuii TaxID=2585211 RepID=UPI0036438FB0
MFVLEGHVVWSASDLTLASECEFAFLRSLDARLRRAAPVAAGDDAMLSHIARLGDAHEARELDRLRRALGADAITEIDRVGPPTVERLRALQETTLAALSSDVQVVSQAGFFDGEFHGYADFVERGDDGWVVCDAKLAREARAKALLQLAAYADQLERAGQPVAATVVLLLGDGRKESFPLAEVLPVFQARRERLRRLVAEHHAEDGPVVWGDERYVACGRCEACAEAIAATGDVLVVAGLRVDHRKRLRAAGISTLDALVASAEPPPGMPQAVFSRLHAQARLQQAQRDAGPGADGRPQVTYEVVAPTHLSALPPPSPGDVFFDFEGDPLYHESDLTEWGLEYLWGVMEAPAPGESRGPFLPWWAHDRVGERAALVSFLDYLTERRARFPDLHVYHYAPYETSALKRLVARYATHERELDALLRAGVFVDLYAVVRGSVRVSQPSYSIKKLEPLYMGSDELRAGEVQAGDASIVEYHAYRAMIEDERLDEAAKRLAELADYNEYDCLSTLRLRDWLLRVGDEAGVEPRPAPVPLPAFDAEDEEPGDDAVLVKGLLDRAGPVDRGERSAEQQAYAMLAAALGYYRRESLPFWWAHFDRLRAPADEWAASRDVFVVESAEVVEDWQAEGRKLARRTLRLAGEWGPGTTIGNGDGAFLLYDLPGPEGGKTSVDGIRAYTPTVDGITPAPHDGNDTDASDAVLVREKATRAIGPHPWLPTAITPGPPPPAESITAAIGECAAASLGGATLPAGPAYDVLARRTPRIRTLDRLPQTGDAVDDLVATLRDLDSSYVPVQGPPGTGKTHTAARVIRRLVEEHGWRIGVVAQSHAVVEHVLDKTVEAGLEAARVGKPKAKTAVPAWTRLPDNGVAAFLEESEGTGCVLGGTAWDFTNADRVPRGSLDLLVVDEAGQFALAPTIGVSVAAQRLLLLGDPQQLPQVSQGTHGEPVDTSALGWVMEGRAAMPADLGYFLGTTYRMHPRLCEAVSHLAYEGALTAHPCTSERDLAGIAPGVATQLVDHHGNRTASVEEAAEVAVRVRALLGTSWSPGGDEAPRPLGEADILVVAPFNAQVHLVRRVLDDTGIDGVRVGTVDKFQGQEAPVVLVSMAASSPDDVPRGMGFLLDRHRVNVAISRAQWRAEILRSDALTSYMPRTPDGVLELGAFLRV